VAKLAILDDLQKFSGGPNSLAKTLKGECLRVSSGTVKFELHKEHCESESISQQLYHSTDLPLANVSVPIQFDSGVRSERFYNHFFQKFLPLCKHHFYLLGVQMLSW
jgi:hypothetical protein